ncbi:MAG: hypothetical protein IJT03_03400 [Clostridia bacterium]|nr:hypothetical protein [Clostridia bacterium]
MSINIISHRGANRIAPQNTMDAFKTSIKFQVDGIETDIHMTKDGVPVICHNYTVNKTSNGKGDISALTLEELRALDFGSYFHPSCRDTKIPTLDEFLELVKKSNLRIMNIEIKSPRDHDYSIVEKVVEAVKQHGLFDILLISSFDPDVLIIAKEEDEGCKTGLLYSPNRRISFEIQKDFVAFARKIGADALHPHKIYVDRDYVLKAHEAGIQVNPWTVNRAKEIVKLAELGVDGLITDVPNVAQRLTRDI